MKRTLILFAAFAALVSCAKENPADSTRPVESFSITLEATAPVDETAQANQDAESRTALIGGSSVHWTNGDQIKVGFPATKRYARIETKTGIFTSTFEEETSAIARFSMPDWNWTYQSGNSNTDPYAYAEKGLAMYPKTVEFSSIRQYDWTQVETSISYTLTGEQTAVENSFESGICFSYAPVDREEFTKGTARLYFKNACALIKVVLPAGVEDVVSVQVESGSNVPLAGKFNVSASSLEDLTSALELVSASEVTSVTLSATDGETLKAGVPYYMVVWPGEHPDGLVFTFTNTDGKTCRKQASYNVVLEAAKYDSFAFRTVSFETVVSYDSVEVGDYFYHDGSFSKVLDEGKELMGVVFYVGDPTKDDKTLREAEGGKYAGCTHGLVVNANLSLGTYTLIDVFPIFMLPSSYSDYGTEHGYMSSIGAVGDSGRHANAALMTGYNNTQALRAFLVAKGYNSPALSSLPNVYPNNATPWFLPSIAECDAMYNNLSTVNASFAAVGKDNAISGDYWTVSETNMQYNAYYKMASSNISSVNKNTGYKVFAVFAF